LKELVIYSRLKFHSIMFLHAILLSLAFISAVVLYLLFPDGVVMMIDALCKPGETNLACQNPVISTFAVMVGGIFLSLEAVLSVMEELTSNRR
jgi:hypothetical protein